MFLQTTVKEKMHLQKKNSIWPWPLGQGNRKCCTVPSTSCDLYTYKVWTLVATSKGLGRDAFTRKYIIWPWLQGHGGQFHTRCCPVPYIMWPMYQQSLMLLHPDAFTRKYIWPWPWGQGNRKCYPVPSTSCDLCTCKIWTWVAATKMHLHENKFFNLDRITLIIHN